MRGQVRMAWALVLTMAAPATLAATYTVGPTGRQYTQLSAVFNNNNLAPGDIVVVDGNATYSGGVVVAEEDGGAAGNPVIIRWRRDPGTSRPVLQGGAHTIKFQQSDHVVLEGFEIRGGSSTCVFNEADDVTVRDSVIHACPAHGILGADQNSGSFTLEYSEIFDAGAGQTKHPIYMQSDEVAHPDSVFRMRYNYVHNGNGGNLLKSRHERNEIYYNWFEGGAYQEIELIGPDCETQAGAWTPGLRNENSDLVGNVVVHTSTSWSNAIRIGGDLNGRNMGHVRLVNNTILFDRLGSTTAVLVQLGQGRLEMHNNLVYQTGASGPAVVRENPASSVDTPVCAPFDREPWASGRKLSGSNNWVQTGASLVPAEWTGTVQGIDPMLTDIAQRQLRPRTGSTLINNGNNAPPAPAGAPFPSPLLLPQNDPPIRTQLAIGGEHGRAAIGGIDIGALESVATGELVPMNGAQPLIPPNLPLANPAASNLVDRPTPMPPSSLQPLPMSPALLPPKTMKQPAGRVSLLASPSTWSCLMPAAWVWMLPIDAYLRITQCEPTSGDAWWMPTDWKQD